jgi:hypothetical protein
MPVDKPKSEGPICPTPPVRQPPSANQIQLRAYLKWEAAGRPPGDGFKFWLEAEQELLERK